MDFNSCNDERENSSFSCICHAPPRPPQSNHPSLYSFLQHHEATHCLLHFIIYSPPTQSGKPMIGMYQGGGRERESERESYMRFSIAYLGQERSIITKDSQCSSLILCMISLVGMHAVMTQNFAQSHTHTQKKRRKIKQITYKK